MQSFLDTYAMIEILQGNPNFNSFLDKEKYTTDFNLLELAYYLVRNDLQESTIEPFLRFRLDIDKSWFFEAAKLKKEYARREFSYCDAIGYIAAIKSGMIFVTGDQQFKDMPNVEFVK